MSADDAWTVGARLRTTAEIDIKAIVYYSAPFSDALSCRIPAGTELGIYAENAFGFFTCRIADKAAEASIVPQHIRDGPKYAGVAFLVHRGGIGQWLEAVPGSRS
jgi:hypothetical protein